LKRVFFLSLFLLVSGTTADVVLFRDSSSLNCEIVSWSKEGLRILRSEELGQEVLPWHRIRTVEGEVVGVGLVSHLKRGEMLWRAKARLLRGDIALATPLFRETYLELKNADGDDAYLAAEGLLRCNLAVGNVDDSVAPWLSVVEHMQHKRETQLKELASIIDEDTFLCPHLPPVWDEFLVAKKLASLKVESDVARALYRIVTGTIVNEKQDYIGPAFLQSIFLLMNSLENISQQEPQELQQWQQVWLLYAQAIQLQKQGKQDEALLKFAEVAAMHATTQPWLAGASMLALSHSFSKDGNDKVSKNIMNEFSRVFPNHPLRKEQ